MAKTEISATNLQESSEEKISKDDIGELGQSHEGTPGVERKKFQTKGSACLSKENSPTERSLRGNDYDYQIRQQQRLRKKGVKPGQNKTRTNMFPKKINSSKVSAHNSKNNTQSHSMYKGQNTDLDFNDTEGSPLPQNFDQMAQKVKLHSKLHQMENQESENTPQQSDVPDRGNALEPTYEDNESLNDYEDQGTPHQITRGQTIGAVIYTGNSMASDPSAPKANKSKKSGGKTSSKNVSKSPSKLKNN